MKQSEDLKVLKVLQPRILVPMTPPPQARKRPRAVAKLDQKTLEGDPSHQRTRRRRVSTNSSLKNYTGYELKHTTCKERRRAIYHARRNQDGLKVAIKVCRLKFLSQYPGDEDPIQELRVFHKLSRSQAHEGSRHIVRLLEAFKTKSKLVIVLEQCKVDLFELVLKKKLNMPLIKKYSSQMLQALSYLHACGYAHLDVSLENVMISQDGNAKLIDFGAVMPVDQTSTGGMCKPLYLAPERLSGSFLPRKADSWSAGMTILALLTHGMVLSTCPKSIKKREALRGGLNAEGVKNQWPHIDRAAAELIARLCWPIVEERWTVDEALQCEWLSQTTS